MTTTRRRGNARFGLLIGFSLTVAACGGRLIDDFESASGPSAAADAATDARPRSDAGVPCGAGGNVSACTNDEWCQYDVPGSCGHAAASEVGGCTARPTVCDEKTCTGVCGCDGHAYCSPCEAERAGTDVSDDKSCIVAGAGGDYSAFALVTNVPRVALFKSDPARNVCFRTILVYGDQPHVFGVQTPQGWAVERAEITNAASDCALTSAGYPVMPAGTTLGASGGDGVITFSPAPDGGASPFAPCALGVHAHLTFSPEGFAWVPGTEPLDADGVKVAGSGPCN